MPLYEYQCTVCNERTEVLQRLGEAPIEVCRACGGPLRKLISSPAFQFKGSGWYATDYAKKSGGSGEGHAGTGDSSSAESVSSSPATAGGKSAEAKSDSGAADKSDAKKATKTEAKATTGS